MTTAQRITKRMRETGRKRGKDSIFAVVSDEHNVHCLTEAHLDCWWESLRPEDKAALYELHLEGATDERQMPRSYFTACGVRTEALNPEFAACLAEVARAAKRSMEDSAIEGPSTQR